MKKDTWKYTNRLCNITILGLELEDWWALIKLLVSVLLMTLALEFTGMLIHEGAHAFVALCFGCKIDSFRFTGFLGAEIGIYAGSYIVPIAFAGGFVKGLYFLVARRFIESEGFWIATLSCWVYALAEVWWFFPVKENPTAMLLLDATTFLTYVILFIGLIWPRSKRICDLSDYYQKASADMSVWVPSEYKRGRN